MKTSPHHEVWIRHRIALALSYVLALCVFGQSNSVHSQNLQNSGVTSSIDDPSTTAFFSRTSPSVRMLLAAGESNKAQPHVSFLSGNRYAIYQDASGVTSVDVFIQSDNPDALQAPGIRKLETAGRIVAARVSLEALRLLGASPAVEYVDLSRKSRPLGKSSANTSPFLSIYPAEARADGALIGLVDTGIDFTHPDLQDSSGTRILYLWDMSDIDPSDAPTDVDPVFDWGREYSKKQIDENPDGVIQRDGDGGRGHGTHVAGVAAGSTAGANLIVVKALRTVESEGDFSEADVLAACGYIFKRAEELGKPAVINLSLGHYDGPLDGSSLFEEALSELTGPGRILVAAAGNGGFEPIHAGGVTEANTTYEAFLSSSQPDRAGVSLWYSPGSVESVSVGFYSRETPPVLLGMTDPVPVGQSIDLVPIEVQGETLGYLSIDAISTTNPQNGDGHVRIALTDNGSGIDLSETLWSVITEGAEAGRQDLWAIDAAFSSEAYAGINTEQWIGNTHRTIASPSTARNVISVGSYVGRNRFINIFGREREWENPTLEGNRVVPNLGQRSYFSGIGPSRDDRVLPHLSAPGEAIVSLLSSHLTPGEGYDIESVQEGGSYIAREGTSVAAAHVTSVVANMLEVIPDLTPETARLILQSTADTDLQTGAAVNTEFGAGKLNAMAAIERTNELAGGGAVASIDANEISARVPPGTSVSRQFTLQNTGSSELSFSIELEQPAVRSPSKTASISTMRTATLDRSPRPFFRPRTLAEHRISAKKGSESLVKIQGQDVLMHDDGNHQPDQFWGFADESRQFFWGNHFILDDFDFVLEKVQFYARTEDVTSNSFWIGIYRSPFILVPLATNRVNVVTSPEGAWYEVELETPLSFQQGFGIFIELAAPQAVMLPAGVDATSAKVGRSYFAELSKPYQNLTTETSSGIENGAFLVRGIGEATRNVNLPPIASAVVSSFRGVEQEEIQFDASSSSDPDGNIVSYLWSFGDGATSPDIEVTHTFETPGQYLVTLSVTDDRGAKSRASGVVRILSSGDGSSERLVVSPTEGVVAPGASQVFDVSYDTANLMEDVYEGRIDISSNAGFFNLPARFDVNSIYVSNEEESELPSRIELEQNHPNPFNPQTTIAYTLPASHRVSITIYDAIGKQVRVLMNDRKAAGRHEITWDARDDAGKPVASGVYFYQLEAVDESGSFPEHRVGQMVLVK